MPQDKNKVLSPAWQQMLGENWAADQEKYLHTLGNLTLTAYNTSWGRVLNKGVTGYIKSSALGTAQVKKKTTNWKSKVVKMNWFDGGSSVLKKGHYGYIYDIDTGITVRIKRMGGSNHADCEPATKADTAKLLFLLSTVANGVFAVNHELNGLVEFSRNLGIVESGEQEVKLVFSSRSARDSQIDRSAAELDAYAEQLGGTVRHYNRYPGWVYAEQSPLREAYIAAYRSVYGRKPKQEVIHAGLECGIVKEAIPDMDILSCGPVVLNLHSPDEALELSSFERFFTVILNFLQS